MDLRRILDLRAARIPRAGPVAEQGETCPGKTCCSLLELERRRIMLTRLMLSDPRFACCTNASCWARESTHPKKKANLGMQFHHVPLYASPGELWRRLKTVLLPVANPAKQIAPVSNHFPSRSLRLFSCHLQSTAKSLAPAKLAAASSSWSAVATCLRA